ncbi:helix-turn-helix domain-containing protein [Paenibacillus kobensis]|uniref:helix-turn-helix domain-containing protein n=1 Tax=Paenibacillus kobensis TaxID=59841 RepID=UPI000FDC7E34|nr:helix-turn-helix domain-containing protein [Paenibacillus kobensis]
MYNVLLVDPDHQSERKTRNLLVWEHAGFLLGPAAADPSEAMSLLNEHSFSLVVINMNRSQDDGLKLCGRIREISRVPIMLIGGSHDFQLVRKALTYQVSDYLPDPVSTNDFAVSLENVKRELNASATANFKALSQSRTDSVPPVNIIDKVKEYVDEALSQNITLKEISNILHFNYSYLGQKFKCHEKMTFNEYLLQQRMEKAKLLLVSTDMKVYEIASEVGYTEMDWFYKKFKAYTGVSANEYRKMTSITA